MTPSGFNQSGGNGGTERPTGHRVSARRPATSLPAKSIGVVFVVFLIFYISRTLQLDIRIPALSAIRFEWILGIFATGPAIIRLVSDRQWKLPSSFWIGTILVVLMTIMTPLSVAPTTSWMTLSNHVIKDAAVGVGIATLVTSTMHFRWFFFSHLLAFAKMAQEGVVGHITGGLVWENQGTPRLHGATNRYDHPNSFGGTQAATLPFLGEFFFSSKKTLLRLLIAAQGIAALDVIVHTGSRTSYLAMILWILYLFFKSKSKARALIVVLCLAATAQLVVPPEYTDRFWTIFTQKDKEGDSLGARREIISDAWEIFLTHPFGVGVAAFPSIRAEKFGRSQDTHNLYLEVATNLGIQGIVVFAALVVSLFLNLKAIRARIDRQIATLNETPVGNDEATTRRELRLADAQFLLAVIEGLRGFLIVRLACGLFGMDLYEPYWWFAIGVVCALTSVVTQLDDPSHETGRGKRGLRRSSLLPPTTHPN